MIYFIDNARNSGTVAIQMSTEHVHEQIKNLIDKCDSSCNEFKLHLTSSNASIEIAKLTRSDVESFLNMTMEEIRSLFRTKYG